MQEFDSCTDFISLLDDCFLCPQFHLFDFLFGIDKKACEKHTNVSGR